MKRILVDMSAVLLHHGHIRLIKKASRFGYVIIALTSDIEIKKKKKVDPELKFAFRKEILESIKGVKKVIKSPWLINNEFLKKNKIDYLVHGNDNKNNITPSKLKIFKKTNGVSTKLIRRKAFKNYKKQLKN